MEGRLQRADGASQKEGVAVMSCIGIERGGGKIPIQETVSKD